MAREDKELDKIKTHIKFFLFTGFLFTPEDDSSGVIYSDETAA